MPPKPPIHIPARPSPFARSRSAPSPSSKLTKPAPPPSSLARIPWHRNSKVRFAAGFCSYWVLFGCVGLWIRDHYIDTVPVQGVSMAPTINPTVHETGKKDRIFITPYLQRARRKAKNDMGEKEDDEVGDAWGIKRGDVVTFWKPHRPEEMGIKRVVALEGDIVYPKRGYALDANNLSQPRLQGMPDGLPDTDPDAVTSGKEELGRVVVPYGHVWVEGDNSRMSWDSRDIGPISKGLVVGKAVWIWRGWAEFLKTGDARSKKERDLASTVVRGRSEIPALFLE